MAAASVVGLTHEDRGLPCEDAWFVQRGADLEGRHILAACVSDGAGSAERGATGAKLVSWVVCHWLFREAMLYATESRERLAESVVGSVKRSLRKMAHRNGVPIGTYASTAVGVSVRSDGQWLAVHIGDGGIVGRFSAGVTPLSLPMKGEFANETFFITDKGAVATIRFCGSTFGDGVAPSGFAVFCDGLEHALINRHTGEVAPALGKMLSWLDLYPEDQVTAALHNNIREVFRDESGDDCTITLLANGLCCDATTASEAGEGTWRGK